MLILICNDDGIDAPGLRHLVEFVKDLGQVVVVAPDRPRSGQSAAITSGTPLTIKRHDNYMGAEMYSVNGTPVDCAKLAMHTILPHKPDLLLSGINHGTNAGNCIIYSGTMGAVLEGCTNMIPSIGFSLTNHSQKANFSACGEFVKSITKSIIEKGLPNGVCLNVNIPAGCIPKGIKVCRAANGYWTDEFKKYENPWGEPFYWLTGKFINTEPGNVETDEYWLQQQWVSVVPVAVNNSDVKSIPIIDEKLR